MKSYTVSNPKFSNSIQIVETADPVHADVKNAADKTLIENDLALKASMDSDSSDLQNQIDGVKENLESTTTDLQSQIEDTSKDLQSQIDDLSGGSDKSVEEVVTETKAITEVTVPASGWTGSSAPYSQDVSVEDMTEDSTFTVGILYPDDCSRTEQKAINKAAGFLYEVNSGDGIVTFKATEKPETDIPLGLRGVM